MPFVNVIQPSGAAPAVDWTDNNVGGSLIQIINTGGWSHDYDYHYPLVSPYVEPSRFGSRWASTNSAGTNPYLYSPEGTFATPANVILSPPYVAVWIPPETAAETNYASNDTKGWHLFERDGYFDGTPEGSTPSANTRAIYKPLAWPTGSNNDDGFLGVGGSLYKPFIAQLSSYSGSTGSGGTDSWSDPFDWSSPRYTLTATLTTSSWADQFNFTSISESGDTGDWEPYGSTPLRFGSQYVDLLWSLTTSGSYSSGNDFFSKTKLNHGRLRNLTNGYDIWNNASYRYYRMCNSSEIEPWGTSAVSRNRFAYFTGGGTTQLSSFSVGDTIQFDMYYSDI